MLDRMHRLLGLVGLAAMIGSAGCGLVLDASPRTDAAVTPDARGMDAFVGREDARTDAPLPDDLDAFVEPEIDAFEPMNLMDAVIPPEDDAGPPTVVVDAHHAGDALVTDVLISTPADAFFMDASAAIDAGRDAGFAASLEAGTLDAREAGTLDAREAGTDANMCVPMCEVIATATSCQRGACVGGSCVGVGGLLPCPRAGSCEQTCGGAAGMLICAWRGVGCSPVTQACTSNDNCMSGHTCVEHAGCPSRICLPACSSPSESCSFTTSMGDTVSGTCDSGVCRPAIALCT